MNGYSHPTLLLGGFALPLLEGAHDTGLLVVVSSLVISVSSLFPYLLLVALFPQLLGRKSLRLHHALEQEHDELLLRREQVHLLTRELFDLLEELDIILRHHGDSAA